jgi:hypothetical protein
MFLKGLKWIRKKLAFCEEFETAKKFTKTSSEKARDQKHSDTVIK